MLRPRLISVLTFNDGVLFRTKDFNPDYRYTLNFVDAWSIDEIVVLDVTRPGKGTRENFLEVVRQFSKRCFVPLAAGGGVRNIDDVHQLMRAGADKVVINTEAEQRPEFISEISRQYGAQCAVISIDARSNEAGDYEVFTEFATRATGRSPDQWAKEAEQCGAGEIMITAIEKDGSLQGYDLELCRLVSDAVTVPVLVSAGAGQWQHFVDGFQIGGASAVCTTNIYHFTETSIRSAKTFLKNAGIPVRV